MNEKEIQNILNRAYCELEAYIHTDAKHFKNFTVEYTGSNDSNCRTFEIAIFNDDRSTWDEC